VIGSFASIVGEEMRHEDASERERREGWAASEQDCWESNEFIIYS
jgi:hypothetical protein